MISTPARLVSVKPPTARSRMTLLADVTVRPSMAGRAPGPAISNSGPAPLGSSTVTPSAESNAVPSRVVLSSDTKGKAAVTARLHQLLPPPSVALVDTTGTKRIGLGPVPPEALARN